MALKRYRLSGADAFTHQPEHPERTARREMPGLDFDVEFQVWPSRASMLVSLHAQERRERRRGDWSACVKEGY